MRIFTLCIYLFLIKVTLVAQLPESNIFQLEIKKDALGNLKLQKPTLLTSLNTQGYNNHPHLVGDSILFFSSAAKGASHPDIYKLNTSSGKLVRFTDTKEGEYSAITMPNKRDIGVLRMEFWPKDTLQRIWSLPLDGQNQGKPILANQTNIGYFRWVYDQGVITFELGNPQTLWYRRLDETASTMIISSPGRCFRVTENGELYYIQKAKPGEPSFIYRTKAIYSSESPKIPIIMPLNQQEDFSILKDGTLIMAEGAKIYQFHPDKNANWELLVDLSNFPIKKITRMEINGSDNKLVLVAQ